MEVSMHFSWNKSYFRTVTPLKLQPKIDPLPMAKIGVYSQFYFEKFPLSFALFLKPVFQSNLEIKTSERKRR